MTEQECAKAVETLIAGIDAPTASPAEAASKAAAVKLAASVLSCINRLTIAFEQIAHRMPQQP